jgi:hypothetical protein
MLYFDILFMSILKVSQERVYDRGDSYEATNYGT